MMNKIDSALMKMRRPYDEGQPNNMKTLRLTRAINEAMFITRRLGWFYTV